MIELDIMAYLAEKSGVSAYLEEPDDPPSRYILVERTGHSGDDKLAGCLIIAQSYAPSLLEAAELSTLARKAMYRVRDELPHITRCECTGDYNFTDEQTHRYRYQAVFDINYYEE